MAEKFVDQIIYLNKEENKQTGVIEHKIWFNAKGGFDGAGGRWTPKVDCIPCSYKDFEAVMLKTISESATATGAKVNTANAPAVTINIDGYDFISLKEEFQTLTEKLIKADPNNAPLKIKICIENILGSGKKVNELSPSQVDLLADVMNSLKETFSTAYKDTKKVEK